MPKVSEEYFDNKRGEIIDAAYRVALSKSISSIQLKDVRDEAGLARGGIYRYYQNLDEILGALILKINSENSYIDDVGKILGDTKHSPATVINRLCDFLTEYLTSRSPEVITLSIQFEIFCIHEPERVKGILATIQDKDTENGYFLFTMLRDYIITQTKKGLMKPSLPADKLIDYFFTVFKGILLEYTISLKMDMGDYDITSMVKAMNKTMLALLGLSK